MTDSVYRTLTRLIYYIIQKNGKEGIMKHNYKSDARCTEYRRWRHCNSSQHAIDSLMKLKRPDFHRSKSERVVVALPVIPVHTVSI